MRDHPLFQGPEPIDVKATVGKPTPSSWRAAMPGTDEIQVLPLCDQAPGGMPGWCTGGGEVQGPECEWICGGINSKQPTHASIWRQGNLLHFGFEPSPAQMNATGQALLQNAIAYIARFVTDRPIVRERTFVDPTGSDAPGWRLDWLLEHAKNDKELADAFAPPWAEKLIGLGSGAREYVSKHRGALCSRGNRFAFDDDALALGVDLRVDGVLLQLAGMLTDPARKDAAHALLNRMLADEPGGDKTPDNWRSWLKTRDGWLCFDPHSHVWRYDPLAKARDERSTALRGPVRADGDAVRDPQVAAIAAKVVAHHGGPRALDDLRAFTCRQGDVRYLWDRAAGLFRVENRHEIPAGNRGTAWRVAALDVTGDQDAIWGGGPPPRPRVSARGMYEDFLARTFAPVLLLQPGTSLRLLPGDGPLRELEVRLAGTCLDQRRKLVLHVDPVSGVVQQIDQREGTRPQSWRVEECTQVGPLLLPTRFTQLGSRQRREEQLTETAWNPTVPDGAGTSTEWILGGG
jgi:hypothetical protein